MIFLLLRGGGAGSEVLETASRGHPRVRPRERDGACAGTSPDGAGPEGDRTRSGSLGSSARSSLDRVRTGGPIRRVPKWTELRLEGVSPKVLLLVPGRGPNTGSSNSLSGDRSFGHVSQDE